VHAAFFAPLLKVKPILVPSYGGGGGGGIILPLALV
jgi:hypothetical protein